jgi:signal transduction histidine kinase
MLVVCKGLVEAQQGRLWAEFNPGKTLFIFSLPLVTYQGDVHDSDDDR